MWTLSFVKTLEKPSLQKGAVLTTFNLYFAAKSLKICVLPKTAFIAFDLHSFLNDHIIQRQFSIGGVPQMAGQGNEVNVYLPPYISRNLI